MPTTTPAWRAEAGRLAGDRVDLEFAATGVVARASGRSSKISAPSRPAGAEQIECDMVEVPLDHDAPDGGTIELVVVVDETAHTDEAEAPQLVLAGGPGGVLVEPHLTVPPRDGRAPPGGPPS